MLSNLSKEHGIYIGLIVTSLLSIFLVLTSDQFLKIILTYSLALTAFVHIMMPKEIKKEKILGSKAKEMVYQFKLSIYQIRAGFLLSVAASLLFLGWGGTIGVLTTMGTIDLQNPPPGWPLLAAVSKYLLGIAIAGLVVLYFAVSYFIIIGKELRKEAESFVDASSGSVSQTLSLNEKSSQFS